MLNKPYLQFIGAEAEFSQAQTVLFGAPFDGTTSFRPGARFAPQAIRLDSDGLETYSPYQDGDLTDFPIMDSGDLELPFGNPRGALDLIKERTLNILNRQKRPFLIGGEHLVTLGALEACAQVYPELRLIHFDAHTDLRQDYLGETLSHATVIRRAHDLLGDQRIYQFGIRSGERAEFVWSSQGHTFLIPYNFAGLEIILEDLKDYPIYFTVDLDVLDPSVFPGTGTPEPGGVSFDQLRQAVTKVCAQSQVVGCDVTELSPQYDPSGVSTAVAAKIIREMLIALHKNKK